MLDRSLVAMLGWAAMSFAWAFSPSTALGGAGRYALDMMLRPIAFSAMRKRSTWSGCWPRSWRAP